VEKPFVIEGADAVTKSYPDFFTDYQKAGGKIIIP
jgi:5-enolpyruvylshikimate-3-phosphate synthase